MNLYIIEERGWGYTYTIVRAATREDAAVIAHANIERVTITLLEPKGEPAILWSEEDCPDSPRED